MVIFIKKYIILIIIFLIIILRIIYINLYKKEYYKEKLKKQTEIYTYGLSSPRGRILDINGNVLVDNSKVRVIVYEKNNNISKDKELSIAKKLSNYLYNEYNISDDELANYILNKENNIKKFISKESYDKYKKQIYSYKDIYSEAINNIKINNLDTLSDEDRKTAKIYALMNKDYKYDKKIIFKNIDDDLYFEIINQNIPGIRGEYIYKRYYPYGSLLKSIFGSVGKIDKDSKEEYLNSEYMLSDEVGTSYLEKEYESVLKGKKAKYKVKKDGTLKLVQKEEKGSDITLNIDLNIELKLEEILKKHISETKGKTNTEYYNGSYVLVGKPTGEIVAALGLKLGDKDNFIETTNDIVNSSFVMGSVVKAASNTVSYHENVITPGKKINDSCVKLYLNNEKCSYKRLGLVDDISALEKSSNYYQYINALKIMGYNNYSYNMKVEAKKEDFDKYRTIFNEYGLGSKTNVDLPKEELGIKGNIISPDLLLNFAIGQYDSYTPVQVLSYINTLASNGKRYNLSLLNKKTNIINNVDIKEENLNRIKTGLNNVVTKGTGRGYIKGNIGAGKTGTSETLVDTNNDGLYETKTISTSFIGYAPFNEPKYTFVVISPNISSNKYQNNYKVPINRYIINDLTSFLFENI